MTYIKIVDWDKFQHYSKRNPPWIKLYAWLLDSDDFEALPDHCKLLLVMLWLIASRKQNAIRLDEKILNKKLPIHRKIKIPEDIQPLMDAGFIECYHDDSGVQATCLPQERQRRDRGETETEVFLSFWNSQKELPKIQSMSDARTRLLKTRMKNTVFATEWKAAIIRLGASDFHTGKNDRQWKATVDWFLKNDTNWVKSLELPDPKTVKPKAVCRYCGGSDNLHKDDTTKIVHCRKQECKKKLAEVRGW